MKTYKLHLISSSIRIFFILTGLFSGILFLVVFIVTDIAPLLGLISLVALPVAGIVFGTKLDKAQAVFTIEDKCLTIEWVKNFKLWPKENICWRFADMEEYVIDYTAEVFILKIQKTDWTKLYLTFEIDTNEPETLQGFWDDFVQAVMPYKLKTGKGMWETTGVKMMAPLMIIVLTGGWYYYLSKAEHDWLTTVGMVIYSVSGLLYIYKIYYYNFRKNK